MFALSKPKDGVRTLKILNVRGEFLYADETKIGQVFDDGQILTLADGVRQAVKHGEYPARYSAHKCVVCGQYFLGDLNAMLCSKTCKRKRKHKVAGVKRANERHAALASTTCSICGAPVNPDRKTKTYCSSACRQKAHRNLVKEKLALLDTL